MFFISLRKNCDDFRKWQPSYPNALDLPNWTYPTTRLPRVTAPNRFSPLTIYFRL